MLRLYKITMADIGHGHCPSKQIVAPDVETAIKAMKASLGQYDLDRAGNPVGVIAVDTITHVDLVAASAIRPDDAQAEKAGKA